MLVGTLAFYYLSLPDLKMAQESAGWPKVRGTIIQSDIRRVETGHGTDKSVSYRPEVRYSYSVEGREYQGMKIHVTEGSSYSHRIAENIHSRYPVGAEVEVSYRPEEQTYALLEPGVRASEILVAAFMLLFVLLGLLILLGMIKPIQKKQLVKGAGVIMLSMGMLPCCTKDVNELEEPQVTVFPGEDITVSSLVTPCGGKLELEDEKGNIIRVSFPEMAVADSTEVILHLKGDVDEQPLETRHIRSFEILPADLRLYESLQITVVFKHEQDVAECFGLFRVPEEGRLQALRALSCSVDGDTLMASSARTGYFTEGIITVEEVLKQMDLIFQSYELLSKGSYGAKDDAGDIADAWADLHADIESLLGFIQTLEENDYYKDNPDASMSEDSERICEKVVCKGIANILKMPVPVDDPCNRDYMQTIGDMVEAMNLLGCDGCQAYSDVQERFTRLIQDCGSFLDTDLHFEVDFDGGNLNQHDNGIIKISARFDEYGVVVVEGSAELPILGDMKTANCTGMISGTSLVFVYGYRDAGYNYTLSLLAEDEGQYYIMCPEGNYTQPFTSTPRELDVELNPANDFTWDKDYPIEEGGNMHVYIKLFNPWAGVQN